MDQQQIHLAQISKSIFVNVAHYEIFKAKEKHMVKSKDKKIEKKYATFELSDNYINSFVIVKNNYKRIINLNNIFENRIMIQKKLV